MSAESIAFIWNRNIIEKIKDAEKEWKCFGEMLKRRSRRDTERGSWKNKGEMYEMGMVSGSLISHSSLDLRQSATKGYKLLTCFKR